MTARVRRSVCYLTTVWKKVLRKEVGDGLVLDWGKGSVSKSECGKGAPSVSYNRLQAERRAKAKSNTCASLCVCADWHNSMGIVIDYSVLEKNVWKRVPDLPFPDFFSMDSRSGEHRAVLPYRHPCCHTVCRLRPCPL